MVIEKLDLSDTGILKRNANIFLQFYSTLFIHFNDSSFFCAAFIFRFVKVGNDPETNKLFLNYL